MAVCMPAIVLVGPGQSYGGSNPAFAQRFSPFGQSFANTIPVPAHLLVSATVVGPNKTPYASDYSHQRMVTLDEPATTNYALPLEESQDNIEDDMDEASDDESNDTCTKKTGMKMLELARSLSFSIESSLAHNRQITRSRSGSLATSSLAPSTSARSSVVNAQYGATYCVCRSTFDPRRRMLSCDACGDWFHFACVGVREGYVGSFCCKHCFAPSVAQTLSSVDATDLQSSVELEMEDLRLHPSWDPAPF